MQCEVEIQATLGIAIDHYKDLLRRAFRKHGRSGGPVVITCVGCGGDDIQLALLLVSALDDLEDHACGVGDFVVHLVSGEWIHDPPHAVLKQFLEDAFPSLSEHVNVVSVPHGTSAFSSVVGRCLEEADVVVHCSKGVGSFSPPNLQFLSGVGEKWLCLYAAASHAPGADHYIALTHPLADCDAGMHPQVLKKASPLCHLLDHAGREEVEKAPALFPTFNVIGSSPHDAYRRFARYRRWKEPLVGMSVDVMREFLLNGEPPLHVVGTVRLGPDWLPEPLGDALLLSRWSEALANLVLCRSASALVSPHVGEAFKPSFVDQVAFVGIILSDLCLSMSPLSPPQWADVGLLSSLLRDVSRSVWDHPMLREYRKGLQEAHVDDYDPCHLLWHSEVLCMVDMLFMCLLGNTHFETLEMSAKMLALPDGQPGYDDAVATALLGMDSPETSSSVYGIVPGMRPLVAACLASHLSSALGTQPPPSRSSCCVS